MKIGILTFHRAINYGAFMQAYSLLTKLQEDFPNDDIEIIDYNNKKREIFLKKCPLIFMYRRSLKEGFQKYIQTVEFKRSLQFLCLSKSFLSCSNEKIDIFIEKTYDIIIVGSDAVFNWNDIGLPNPYFLYGIKSKKKLSYAASAHLQKYDNVSKKEKKYLRDALKDFFYLGVRDNSTARFVDGLVKNAKSRHNCDPSIFLKLNFSEMNLVEKLKRHKFDFSKKTVFVMLMNSKYGKYVKQYFGKECQIVALMDGNKYADNYLYDLNPFEWAHVFKYGNFLVTDYFHGTIFGLKNKIPVMSIDASKYCVESYESKAKDLLVTRLGLQVNYVNGKELEGTEGYRNFAKRIEEIQREFDPELITKKIEEEAKSYSDFKKALEKLHK